MKKIFFAFVIAASFTACTVPTTLYSWDNYVDASYNFYKKQTPESKERLLTTYEKMIKKPTGTRKVEAPGVYAEYGYLLLQNDKTEEGLEMLQKERELYPESAIFINALIDKFSK